jgi:hypothetical protein
MKTLVKKTLEQWQNQLDDILLNIRNQFLRLGETLYFAQKELSKADYDKLISYVAQYSLKDADIKSAIAAFLSTREDLGDETDKRIDPALVFAGAKNSKILFMDKQDQKRLLSKEKFEVVMQNGKPDKPKTWNEMNEVQRNTLIGKGGQILSVSEQINNLRGKKNTNISPLGEVLVQGKNIVLVDRDNIVHLTASFAEFARMLFDSEAIDPLDAAVKDFQQERGPKRQQA